MNNEKNETANFTISLIWVYARELLGGIAQIVRQMMEPNRHEALLDGRRTVMNAKRQQRHKKQEPTRCPFPLRCRVHLQKDRPLSPLPCNAAAPKGPAFCFFNY